MANEASVELVQAFTRLKGLRDHLPDTAFTEGRYGDEFHKILAELENVSKTALSKYRIADSAFQRNSKLSLYLVDCRDLKMKADAVLEFFTIVSTPQREIGFKPQ